MALLNEFYRRNMKSLLILLGLSFSVCSLWAENARWRDGEIEFVKYKVNGKDCFTDKERDAEVDKYNVSNATFSISIVAVPQDNYEVTLATCGIKYSNFSDFQMTRDDKNYAQDKFDDIPPSLERKQKRSIDFLKSENAK